MRLEAFVTVPSRRLHLTYIIFLKHSENTCLVLELYGSQIFAFIKHNKTSHLSFLTNVSSEFNTWAGMQRKVNQCDALLLCGLYPFCLCSQLWDVLMDINAHPRKRDNYASLLVISLCNLLDFIFHSEIANKTDCSARKPFYCCRLIF